MKTDWQCAFLVAALAAIGGMGCEGGVPKEALALTERSLEDRQLQTRRFDTRDEARLLSASAGLLQDLGFAIESSESRLGFLLGSKERDATDGGQIAAAVLIGALFGATPAVDKNQRIRVSVVTMPLQLHTNVRVTFQRIIWNTDGQVSRLEFVNDPKIYQEFFVKLSKAVFLEAHQL